MSILSSIVTRVRSIVSSAKRTTIGRNLFGIKDVHVKLTDTGFLGKTQRIFEVANQGKLANATSQAIGLRLLEQIKEEAGKFSRTGSLVESLYLQQVGEGRYVIDSDLPYKSTWLHADGQGSASVQSLMDWMSNKSEFEMLGPKEMSQVAYAIRRSFETGAGAGSTGASTLRKLNPSGERAYDYVRAAMKQIEPELQNLGLVFREI